MSGNVRYLPSAGDPNGENTDLELSDAIEGELLTAEENAEVAQRFAVGQRVEAIRAVTERATVITYQRVRQSPVPPRVGKALVRNTVYAFRGFGLIAKRVRDANSNSRYERVQQQLEHEGKYEELAAWMASAEKAKAARHDRATDWFEVPAKLARAAAVGGATLMGILLALGAILAVAYKDASQILAPLVGVVNLVKWISIAVTVAWLPLLLAVPFGFLIYCNHQGRRYGNTPTRWMADGDVDRSDPRHRIPDESAVLNALRHLGIGPLDKAFKRGWGAPGTTERIWEQGATQDGKGWRLQLRLPQGANVAMINSKKDVLAHNLVRIPAEVWPTEPRGKPGVLDLWVANPGALSGPVEPWPLLREGTCDYFKGVPAGINIRGDSVTGRLFEANYAVAGMMGSGKSTLIIALLLGAMLDPLVDIDVFVMADNFDYEPMVPRLRTLTAAPGQDTVQAALACLREVYSDLTTRGQALREHGERSVNRKIAAADPRLRPRIVVVDECQALFMSEDEAEVIELVVKVISAARKYAVTLMFATPEPSTASLPRKVISVISNKACFAIGDQQSNDSILGTGSYSAGISAVGLEPKTDEGPGDIGTAMVRGFMPKPGLLRSYYIRQGWGVDEVTPVVQRALALREDAGIGGRGKHAEQRNLLDDVAEVLGGEDRVNVVDVAARLRKLAPGYKPYDIDGTQLADQLTREGVRVTQVHGYFTVYAERVHTALSQRADEDG